MPIDSRVIFCSIRKVNGPDQNKVIDHPREAVHTVRHPTPSR